MIRFSAFFLLLLFLTPVHAMVLNDCPANSLQSATPESILINNDGTMVFTTNVDDDMQGNYGGNVRAEVNSKHSAYADEIIEYHYRIKISDPPMNYPVVIFQLKQSGHSPTVALEWKNNKVYIKHRYSKNGVEHGPTMDSREIVSGEIMDWRIRVKISHEEDGYIESYDGHIMKDRYMGPTLLPGSDSLHLKYGIYSWKFVDGITSRKLDLIECGITQIDENELYQF